MTRYLSSIGAFMLLLLLPAAALAERPDEPSKPADEESEPETIPLDQIWAYRMPGTRDILKLAPSQNEVAEKGIWDSIVWTLLADVSPDWPREGERARSGFAVSGRELVALRNAQKVLVKGQEPSKTFTTEDEVTLVFFSYQYGTYIHLRHVKRQGELIELQYRFVRPIDMISSVHLALIPLGKLPAGRYHVKNVRLSTAQELFDTGYETIDADPQHAEREVKAARRFVSRSFRFSVVEREEM